MSGDLDVDYAALNEVAATLRHVGLAWRSAGSLETDIGNAARALDGSVTSTVLLNTLTQILEIAEFQQTQAQAQGGGLVTTAVAFARTDQRLGSVETNLTHVLGGLL